jgi:membrane protease YdiL (CAAX protease family)
LQGKKHSEDGVRAFFQNELKPFLADLPAEATWPLVVGTALLVAKREFAGLEWGSTGLEHRPWAILAGLWGVVLGGTIWFGIRERRRRLSAGEWAAVGVALGMFLLAISGACRLGFWAPLFQPHYAKISWLLASAAWLGPLPLILILTVLHGRPADFGWGWGRWRMWGPVWAGLSVLMLAVVLMASRWADFRQYYPMYRATYPDYLPQRDGWSFFLQYELAYGVYFLAWEFFFRSFMLFTLARLWGGPQAILVQMVPFTLMHIGKPTPEFFSAIIAGLALGWLAWRGRSFWPCFLLHWTCAAAMDLFAVLGPG